MARKPHYVDAIHILRKRFYTALPGKESLVHTLNEAEVPEQVYNSNAIENSTLSLEETEKILLEIDLERYVQTREVHEAKNLARVTEYMEEKSKTLEMDIQLILLLHKMLLGNIDEHIAGRLRSGDEWVRVGSYVAPGPTEVSSLLETLLMMYQSDSSTHIVRRIARFHLEFERIHPFCDGNGRIGRVLNNYLLLREGYVPINIVFAERRQYYGAFKQYIEDQKSAIMEEIIGHTLVESYHKRLAYMEGRNICTLIEYAKKNKLSYSNLLNKAKRQTIEAFRERGIWKIRDDFK